MQRISIFFFIIIHSIILFDGTKQSQVKQAISTVKAIGNTIKSPLFRQIGNMIKKPIIKTFGNNIKNSLGMLNQNKNSIKNLACGLQKKYVRTMHNFGIKSVKYLGEQNIKKFKFVAPYITRSPSKKNIQKSSDLQMNGKQLRHMTKRSIGYMKGKDIRSLINMVSKSKPQLPFLAGGTLMSVTQLNLMPLNGDVPIGEPIDSNLKTGSTIKIKKVRKTATAKKVKKTATPKKVEKGRIKNKAIYEGELVGGKMQGKGKLIYPNGNIFEGEFFNDRIQEGGNLTFPDENIHKAKSVKIIKQYLPEKKGENGGMAIIGGQEKQFDPILLLAYFNLRLPKGFPDHPHRGFETATYITEGSMHHEDFLGNFDKLETGDCQWMTAGKGIIHAEMPGSHEEFTRGFQLWVNLPRDKKMMEPCYQDFKSKDISEFNDPDGQLKVRVIAGESYGVKSKVTPHSSSIFMDIWLGPGKEFKQQIPPGWQGLQFVYQGQNLVLGPNGNTKISFEQSTIFESDGNSDTIIVNSLEQIGISRFILIAGLPLNEPIKSGGPFIMNTEKDLYDAFDDYEYARNGFENAEDWKSKLYTLQNIDEDASRQNE